MIVHDFIIDPWVFLICASHPGLHILLLRVYFCLGTLPLLLLALYLHLSFLTLFLAAAIEHQRYLRATHALDSSASLNSVQLFSSTASIGSLGSDIFIGTSGYQLLITLLAAHAKKLLIWILPIQLKELHLIFLL